MFAMKEKFIHPSSKALVIHSYVLVVLASGFSFASVCLRPYLGALIALAAFAFFLCLGYLAYIVYGVIDFARRKFKAANKWHMAKNAIKENAILRRAITSSAGALANFVMATFYFIIAAINSSFFYVLIGGLHILAFSARLILLFQGIDPSPKKQSDALMFASIFCSLIGTVALGVTLYVYLAEGNFQKSALLIYALAFYTFWKLVSAIRNYIKARRKQSLLLLAYSEISLCLVFFSLFVLQVEMIKRAEKARI